MMFPRNKLFYKNINKKTVKIFNTVNVFIIHFCFNAVRKLEKPPHS